MLGPEDYSLSIRKSECPKEREPADRRSSVHVNLIRRDEECPRKGRTLGSSSVSEPVPEADVSSSLNTAPSPSMGMVVDKSLPSTSIQLRLADGTCMVISVPSLMDQGLEEPGPYHSQTVGFPPKVLTDPTQTMEQAGPLSSVVIQKL
ncbi:plant UBX domain-containing 4-like [Olea europaea subsp. europaea]|uniref:Plant UBX domain-containing 4-like n=1 Tax=Olea europaea subsp. europaea TaxID=158383 RepID=A0A8S0SYL4_OLEEU|nr:plant UBX domain-containing 4-like [Olea europaea subsp. europaea]